MGPHSVNAPIIFAKELTYSYPNQKTKALDGISLSANRGNILGLLGPNGGGKSTAFKILSTLMTPSSGSIEIAGIDLLKHPEKVRALLGVVFQFPALDKKLTVLENLIHQGHLYGMKGPSLLEKAELLLRRLDLWERRQDKTETLSGGLKRRLEITKCLLHSPKILILDEPTTGLDPLARREVWNLLHWLREKENITILVTTHLLEEADDCDEIAILNQGRVVCAGKPLELREGLGNDVVTIRVSRPTQLIEKITQRFNLIPNQLGNDIRMQPKDTVSFVGALLSDFSKDFDSLTVGKPTLEDLFITKTGHRFWKEIPSDAKGDAL